MSPQALTSSGFWQERHEVEPQGYDWPRPGRYLLDCELDHVFRRHLGRLRGGKILEIGCGSSVWLPYFENVAGLRIYGIDYSLDGILHARSIVRAHSATGVLVLGDVFLLENNLAGRFDCVFSLGVVEHFADPETVLAAFSRFLTPGGVMITWAPNVPGRIVRLSTRLNPAIDRIYGPVTLDSLVAQQKEAGLEVVEAIYTQFADFTLVNLGRLPRRSRLWVSRFFRLASMPFVALGNAFGFFIRSRALSSGMLTVARRPLH